MSRYHACQGETLLGSLRETAAEPDGAGLADERYCASDEEIRPDLDLANSGLSLFAQLSDAEVVDLLA